ncbi:TonB-dependent receptor domain-containing protein [Tahibacter soli]|uniref:TonB-dependent receptor n=1 Tax=Tahibacter soli TaxID=2983605 RepID=A0A9X3YHW5_9GAMM|nr:TonB-dependent receptor [Tahibacter soli]MDC8011311.1 TonB-dependent receptor [Tahibacter soli]
MRQNSNELLRAVRYALYVGTTAAVGLSAAPVFAQDAGENTDKLETIVVTGSRIRRVDLETSSPVFVIDKSAIEKTGKVTIGDLLQEAPSIAGAATNPSVNNGGGSGAATVSLRGLGSQRTLLLLNGHRVFYNDVNSIPINMVERIEILKDGASAVYGSDAIGGVVNFITRRDFQGLEASFDYGVSDRDDGERKGVSMTLGHASDRGSVVVGMTYNRQRQVGAGEREFSSPALYNYRNTSIFALGSGSVPNGRLVIPRSRAVALGINCPGTSATVNVTRISGTRGTAATDYRCYVASGANNDSYDYSPYNLELTPTERAGLFAAGNYRITDNVEAYVEAFTNKTRSKFVIAPLPLILGINSGAIVSADSIYNPFGVNVSSGGTRTVLAGNREGRFSTQADQISTGLRGSFGDTWQWDAGITWARTDQTRSSSGYYYKPGLAAAVGPSFYDADGVARCGRPGAVIAGCVPINIFNVTDGTSPEGRANLEALQALAITPFAHSYATEKTAQFNLTGELFELPAGAVSLALGGEYRKDYQYFQPDFASLITNPNTGECLTSTDACASPNSGELSVKEVYAEFFIPVLRDVFLAKSLNFTLGSRYSDYSAFGDTTNSKLGLEWRPIDDLLIRGTIAEVFRSPTISDLYGGITPSADTYRDPCDNLSAADVNNPACQGLQPGFQQLTQQTQSLQGSNVNVLPEQGKSFTWGFVYDPNWLEGFSTSVDVWRIYLTDTIGALGTQNILDQCFINGNYCNLFTREAQTGDVNFVNNTTQNVGRIDTSGIDIGFKYRLPETAWGNFRASLDATYLQKYNVQSIQGVIETQINYAGSYQSSSTGGNGNFARWRALAALNWNLGAFDASWRVRYIGPSRFGDTISTPSGYNVIAPVIDAGHNSFRTGAYTYHNLQLGYNIEPINTHVELGIDNVFDKQAPVLWQYGFNGNTDERTYDTVGRYFWARVGVKF